MSGIRMPYADGASALLDRVRLVLSQESLDEVYGKEAKIKAPKVTNELADNRPPFYAWVIPIARTSTTTGSATAHEHQTSFELYVFLCVTHRNLDVALRYINHWIHSVMMGIAADATLNRTVDVAIPSVVASGYDSTPDNRHLVSADITVRCTVYSQCPTVFKELIANAKDQS